MATEQRIYKVTGNGRTQLVRASSQAQALRHIAGEIFTVEVAKIIEVADLIVKGVHLKVAPRQQPRRKRHMVKGVHLKVAVPSAEQAEIFGQEIAE